MNHDDGRTAEDEAYERFTDLCSDLNLDSLTKDNTWRTFATVRQKYTLEVSYARKRTKVYIVG